MKKYILFAALLINLSIKSYSQIAFEYGYFIDESNQQINCLIKDIDWKNNPSEFEYKLSQDATIQKADIQSIKEFGINGVSKYIHATVKIDKSGNDLTNMSSQRNPIFQEESLFLKVLVEGKASLFFYEKGSLRRFFYKTNDSPITQLVYKRYLMNNMSIARNNSFRQQISIDLRCHGITEKNVENINYNKKNLEKLFVDYNECANSEYVHYELKQKKDLFNLSIRPGLNFSSLVIKNHSADSKDTDFGNKLNFRLGIEAEFILPYNKNKWSIILEPTYQYFTSEKTTETNTVSGRIINSKMNYQSIELPIGLRHYFFLNDESKIFADISYIFDYSSNSVINFTRIDGSSLGTLEVKSSTSLGLGIGYKLKDKYSLGMRYQTSRDILSRYILWNSSYETFSIIFGYSVF